VTDAVRFDPVARRTVSEEIRAALLASIQRGELAPGMQLPSERELCDQFGVARTSVREAIQGLVTLGLLEKRGNRSYVVEHLPSIRFDGEDRRKRRVHELFEVRQIVEVPIARLAACHASDADRAEIARIAAQFRDDMELGEFRVLDRAFHTAVARACGNATLAELHHKVLDTLFHSGEFDELLSAPENADAVRDTIRGARQAHQAIAAGIAEGDWAAVVEAAERHLDQVEHQMISRMT
jgi:DNA-binding FadR family transcriptional regulator